MSTTTVASGHRGAISRRAQAASAQETQRALMLLQKWVEDHNYRGYEPFDGLSSWARPLAFGNQLAERILQHFELSHHFQKVYGADLDGRFDDKAELIAYLLASEGVSARQAVMIGDRAADVLAAKANGLRSIGVLWGYGSEQELADAGADLILQTPSELSAHLSKAQSN